MTDALTPSTTPEEEAAALLTWLQAHQAVCEIDADGSLRVDLNPVACIRDHAEADALARVIFSLRDEIKGILLSRGTVH